MTVPISILLADKEVPLLESLAGIFEEHGYHTSLATSLDQAFSQLNLHTFHLVITDIWDTYPITTLHITQSLQQQARPIPTGIMTGWKVDANIAGRESFAFVISKPFDIEYLLAQVDETLAAPMTAVDHHRSEIVQRYFAALTARDWETIAAVCSDHLRYILQSSDQVIEGRDAYITYAKGLFGNDYQQAHFSEIICFAYPYGITARFNSQWNEADGHVGSTSGSVVFHFAGDRITQIGVDVPTMSSR